MSEKRGNPFGCGNLIIAGAAIICGLVFWNFVQHKDAREGREAVARGGPSPDGRTLISASPEDVRAAYAANEVNANARFNSGRVQLSGEVQHVIQDIGGRPVIQFVTRDPIATVNAAIDMEDAGLAAGLQKRDTAVVVCDGASITLGVITLGPCAMRWGD